MKDRMKDLAYIRVTHEGAWVEGRDASYYEDVVVPGKVYHVPALGEVGLAVPATSGCGIDTFFYLVDLAIAEAVARPCKRCYPKKP